MVNINITAHFVDLLLQEIFQRMEHSECPEVRQAEANYAWFQIFAMRKFMLLTDAMQSVQLPQASADQSEYRKIATMLNEALQKVEATYEATQT